MENLIIIGSPRKGLSEKIANYLNEKVKGTVLRAYDLNISPCYGCEKCKQLKTCFMNDDMNIIYDFIKRNANILFITPIYFLGLPAPVKIIIDRTQVFWNHPLPATTHKGVAILLGDQPNKNDKITDYFNKQWAYIFKNWGIEQFLLEIWGEAGKVKNINKELLSNVISFLKGE